MRSSRVKQLDPKFHGKVLLRDRGGEDTKRRRHCDHRGSDRKDAAKEHQGYPQPSEAGGAEGGRSPRAFAVSTALKTP